jgi:uncharacterized protein YdhG (YjbR/CyaY superfamily)
VKKAAGYTSIDAYIASFPEDVQEKLTSIRTLIRSIVPEASEKISYQMPTFYLNGNLIHFAAFSKHIGLYPAASGVAAFEPELDQYQHSKGAIQFPLSEPLPMELIERIVRYRVEENRKKGKKPRAAGSKADRAAQ